MAINLVWPVSASHDIKVYSGNAPYYYTDADSDGTVNIYYDSTDYYQGPDGSCVAALGANSRAGLRDQKGQHPVFPGGKYVFYGAVKGNVAGAVCQPCLVFVGHIESNGGHTAVLADPTPVSTTWTPFAVTAVAPDGAASAFLAFLVSTTDTPVTVKVQSLARYNLVSAQNLDDSAVTSSKIATGAVTSSAIASGAVLVTALDLAPGVGSELPIDAPDGQIVANLWATHGSGNRQLNVVGAPPPTGETHDTFVNIAARDGGSGILMGGIPDANGWSTIQLNAGTNEIYLEAAKIRRARNDLAGNLLETFGPSFPSSPTTGDRHYRTDLHCFLYFDGANWLSEQELEAGQFEYYPGSNIGEISAAGTNEWLWYKTPKITSNGVKVTRFGIAYYINGTANGSNYWQVSLRTFTGLSSMATHTLQTGSAWTEPTAITSFSAQPTSSDLGLEILVTKVGSPGPLRFAPLVMYRHILG